MTTSIETLVPHQLWQAVEPLLPMPLTGPRLLVHWIWPLLLELVM